MKLKSITYDRLWDKLRKPEHTTIRARYSENGMDKLDYYKVGEEYQQIIKGTANSKPYDIRTLVKIEESTGAAIDGTLLAADVMFDGKPDMEWVDRVRGYHDALILHFEKVDGIITFNHNLQCTHCKHRLEWLGDTLYHFQQDIDYPNIKRYVLSINCYCGCNEPKD